MQWRVEAELALIREYRAISGKAVGDVGDSARSPASPGSSVLLCEADRDYSATRPRYGIFPSNMRDSTAPLPAFDTSLLSPTIR